MTDKKGIVNIHGKDYMTVARRLEIAHHDKKLMGVKTEVLQYAPVVVVKATVILAGIEYQGISSANPAKSIEKSNPFEVAETSAVGRALGFAGYGLIESVATADDMTRAIQPAYTDESGITHEPVQTAQPVQRTFPATDNDHFCTIHNKPMKERTSSAGGTWFDHRWKVGEEWHQCKGKPKAETPSNYN